MFLNQISKKNTKLKVIRIHSSENLWKYGIFEKSTLTYVKQVYGNVIINFENHQYVIMKNLAKKIEVEYE